LDYAFLTVLRRLVCRFPSKHGFPKLCHNPTSSPQNSGRARRSRPYGHKYRNKGPLTASTLTDYLAPIQPTTTSLPSAAFPPRLAVPLLVYTARTLSVASSSMRLRFFGTGVFDADWEECSINRREQSLIPNQARTLIPTAGFCSGESRSRSHMSTTTRRGFNASGRSPAVYAVSANCST